MQVFNEADGYHDRRAGQSEEEQDLEKVHSKVSEDIHDGNSIVR
jgi:hypothetical protein